MVDIDRETTLVGGALCLDFANTIDARFPRAGEQPFDYIGDYDKLVRWSRTAGAIDAHTFRRLLAQARRDPHSARAAHSGALGLREAIYACLAAPLARAPPPAWAASDLQRFAAHAIEHGRLVPAPDAPRFMLEWTEPSLDRMLWPIAHSAHTLATSDEIRRVKQCPGQDGRCGWLFLDGTKNNTRRWCDMRVCGNPVKTRRQSERRRKARARRA